MNKQDKKNISKKDVLLNVEEDIQVKFLNCDKKKAKRILSTDDAFGLLWDIDNTLRGYLKYGTEKTASEIMEEIRNMIYQDNILDLYE
jgi:hypothetical protein